MKRPIFISSIVAILFSSCNPQMYFPDRVNTPCLIEKGEGKATFSAKPHNNYNNGQNNYTFSPAADLAYAASNRIGVIASYRSLNNRLGDEGIDNSRYGSVNSGDTLYGGRYNGHRFEAGLGTFWKFEDKGMMEVYGGAGWGNMRRKSFVYPSFSYNTEYYRIFLQYAVGAYNRKILRMTGGGRVVLQHYYRFSSPNSDLIYNMNNDVEKPVNFTLSPYVFFEPYVNIEVGLKWVRLSTQFGATMSTGRISRYLADNGSLYGYLGLSFCYYSGMFKKKNIIVE